MTDDFKPVSEVNLDKVEKPKPKWGGKREKVVVDELLTRQVASLMAVNHTRAEIAKELEISYTLAGKLMGRKDVANMIRDIGESSVISAKAQIRLETAGLVRKIMAVIHKNLDEGNLDAVKIGLKVLGFNDQEAGPTGVQSLTIVLPGAEAPTVVESEVLDV